MKSVLKLMIFVFIFSIILVQYGIASEKPFEDLISDLASPSVRIRTDAAWALGELGDKRAVEHLVKALCDPDDSMRYYVVKALKNLKDEGAVPDLEKALDLEVKPWVVQAIKEAIDELKQ